MPQESRAVLSEASGPIRVSLEKITVYQRNGMAYGTPLTGGVTSYKTCYLKELPEGWGLQTRQQAAQRGLISAGHSPVGGHWPRTVSWGHGRKHSTTRVKEGLVSVRRV